MPPLRLGERLVERGLLSPATVRRALGYQQEGAPRARLGSILLTWDLIDESALIDSLAALHRCEAVTGEMLLAAPVDVVRLLPRSHALRLNALPYARAGKRLRVAFVDPSDLTAVDEVAALTAHACVPGVATELRLLQAHRRFHGRNIPFELRPAGSRRETPRPPSVAFAPISIVAEPRLPEMEAVPDMASSAVPPPPPRSHADAAIPAQESSAPDDAGSGHWIASLPDLPPDGEEVLGMWSSPPPARGDEDDAESGDLALAAVPPEFPRVILLRERGAALSGWRARGLDPPAVDLLRFGAGGASIFAAVLATGTPHFGRLDPALWPDPLPRLLPGPPPCAVFPIHGDPRGAAVLYADRRGAPMRFEDTGRLARAAAEIAALLLRLADDNR